MRLSCFSLYVAIKALSTSAEVSRGSSEGATMGTVLKFFNFLQSIVICQRRLGQGSAATDRPSEGSKGREVAWVWRHVRGEGSAEAFTKAAPDQRVCLE